MSLREATLDELINDLTSLHHALHGFVADRDGATTPSETTQVTAGERDSIQRHRMLQRRHEGNRGDTLSEVDCLSTLCFETLSRRRSFTKKYLDRNDDDTHFTTSLRLDIIGAF